MSFRLWIKKKYTWVDCDVKQLMLNAYRAGEAIGRKKQKELQNKNEEKQ